MHTVEHGRLRAHFNSDLSGDVRISTEGGTGITVLPGELVQKIARHAVEKAHDRNDRQVIANLRDEIQKLRAARDMILATEVYDAMVMIASLGCNTRAVLGGDDCGKCGPCVAKPIEAQIREQGVRMSWSDWQTKLKQFREVCRLPDVRSALETVEREYPQPVQRAHAKWALNESKECGA